MEQWERDIRDLRKLLKELEPIVHQSLLLSKEYSLKLVEVIAEAKSRAVRCYISYSRYGQDMESSQSSVTTERK